MKGKPKRLPYSDIDLSRWREYDHIRVESLWLIPSRDRTGGHRLDYHGGFVPQIATQTFLRYTRQDDIVLDLFLGSGTSAIEAVRLNRRLIGVELQADLVEKVRGKVPANLLDERIFVLQGDSTRGETADRVRTVLERMDASHAHLLVLHPPYHDIIRFSDDPADLSNAPDLETFLDRFEAVARNGFDLLEPGRFAVLVVGDKYTRGELIPLGFYCMDRMQRVGFRLKAIVVKNITRNERGKGRTENLWRYRALAGGYYLFKHEYVMIFQRPQRPNDIRQELLRVQAMLPWGRVQSDAWDTASRFIYSVRTLDDLRRETKRAAREAGLPLRAFGQYVLRRWYNYHTHQIVLEMILAHPRTRAEADPFHPTVDFYLDGIGFDLKMSEFPRAYPHDLRYALDHPEDLARWLYIHQSQQGRFHGANRLFIVLHDAADPDRTWELRRDFERLQQAVHTFLDSPRLFPMEFTDGTGRRHTPTTGVIFCIRALED